MKISLQILALSFFVVLANGQTRSFMAPKSGNPVLPGYFADPCIVKMDEKYYIYATTVSKFMEPMVWESSDLLTWEVKPLNITGHHFFWAPSVLKGDNNLYYLYFTSGYDFKCHLYIGESPSGPWKFHGQVEKGFDLEIFRDPSTGKVYGSSSDPQSRPRLVEFESDVKKPGYLTKVINEKSLEGVFFDYTEGSYILYRDGWYYFMYSGGKCHAENYKVNYARSRDIWGPYEDAPNNSILERNPEKDIYGPGHHSVLSVGEQYFMVYHRQDFYFYPTCSERQVCIDKMDFDENGWIKKVEPTHTGVDFSEILKTKTPKLQNVAFGKKVTSNDVKGKHNPDFAVDNNYATYWIGGGSGYFLVDLEREYEIEKIVPRFLYYDYHLLYKILYSSDSKNWNVYHDQTGIAKKAANAINHTKVKARYVKIEFVRGEGTIGLAELEVMTLP